MSASVDSPDSMGPRNPVVPTMESISRGLRSILLMSPYGSLGPVGEPVALGDVVLTRA